MILFLFCTVSFFPQQNQEEILTTVINPTASSETIKLTGTESYFPIIVLGEVRRVSTLESFYVWESFVNGGKIDVAPEINDEERIRIIRNIASKNPNSVLFLGDMVNYGSKEHNWQYFDEVLRPLVIKKISLYSILGEHEYWGRNSQAKKYIVNRFPFLSNSTWYSKTSDGICLVFLNSNKDEISSDEWESQLLWFEKTITRCDEDPEIRGVIVFMHHAPFTNSTKGESEHVKSAFLPRFIAAKKTMLLVSGSAATYERFDKYGKAFIVTGGGGAPRDELYWDNNSLKDEYRRQLPVDGNRYRPFNFVEISPDSSGLKIKVTGLNKGNVNFFIMEEFNITFPLPIDKQAALE